MTGRHLLVVDDDAIVRETIRDSVEHLGYSAREAGSAEEALEAIAEALPDLILLDVRMPGMTGIDLCRQLKSEPRTRLVPVVLLTAQGELESRIAGLEAGADDYFTKPVHLRELGARLESLVRLKLLVEELEHAENMITSLGLTVEARDTFTAGHCQRLASLAVGMGERLGLGEDQLKALRLGGFLHDLGKVSIPDAILLKPGPLDAEEWRIMREHPVVGERLAEPMRTLALVRPIIRSHHERMDGRGYPDGLAGREIPLLARIVSVVDAYDAIRAARPYKPALPEEEAIRRLAEGARTGHLDPEMVRIFFELRGVEGP